MNGWIASLVRWGIVLAVAIGLPILAVPSLSRSVGSLLYGGKGERLPDITPETAPPLHAPPESDSHANVSYEQPVELAPPPSFSNQAAFQNPATPPDLEARPAFTPLPRSEPAELPQRLPGPSNLGPDWKERVSAVRVQLERWGADYLLLETTGTGGYRFHCRMTPITAGQAMQDFEATSSDPADAAEQVFDQIAEWRATLRRRP